MSSADTYTRDHDKRFTLRIERKLFEIVEASARKNGRAVGREIEFILAEYFGHTLGEYGEETAPKESQE